MAESNGGDLIWIRRPRPFCNDVLQNEPRVRVDEKRLLHAIDERVQENYLGERPAGPARFDAPLHRLDGEASFEGLVEALHEGGDGRRDALPDGRPDRRGQKLAEPIRLTARKRPDCSSDCRLEGCSERGLSLPGGLGDRLRQDPGDRLWLGADDPPEIAQRLPGLLVVRWRRARPESTARERDAPLRHGVPPRILPPPPRILAPVSRRPPAGPGGVRPGIAWPAAGADL